MELLYNDIYVYILSHVHQEELVHYKSVSTCFYYLINTMRYPEYTLEQMVKDKLYICLYTWYKGELSILNDIKLNVDTILSESVKSFKYYDTTLTKEYKRLIKWETRHTNAIKRKLFINSCCGNYDLFHKYNEVIYSLNDKDFITCIVNSLKYKQFNIFNILFNIFQEICTNDKDITMLIIEAFKYDFMWSDILSVYEVNNQKLFDESLKYDIQASINIYRNLNIVVDNIRIITSCIKLRQIDLIASFDVSIPTQDQWNLTHHDFNVMFDGYTYNEILTLCNLYNIPINRDDEYMRTHPYPRSRIDEYSRISQGILPCSKVKTLHKGKRYLSMMRSLVRNLKCNCDCIDVCKCIQKLNDMLTLIFELHKFD